MVGEISGLIKQSMMITGRMSREYKEEITNILKPHLCIHSYFINGNKCYHSISSVNIDDYKI